MAYPKFDELEFLALKWSVTWQFQGYLYYAPYFDVYSNYNPLQYIFTAPKLDATRLRWVSLLPDFNFKIHYKPGGQNSDADGLSRMPLEIEPYTQKCTEECSQDMIDSALAAMRNDEPINQTVSAKEAKTQDNVLLAQLKIKSLNLDNKSGTKGKKPSRSDQSKLTIRKYTYF